LLLSLPGDWAVVVAVLAALYLWDVLASLRDGPATDEPLCSDRTAVLIATVFGGLALAIVLKATFGLPRPPADLQAVPASEDSFPSGHTMTATVFWGALGLWAHTGTRRGRVGIAAVVVALVALSRLALGVHYLVDVAAAVGFGCLYLGAVCRLGTERPAVVFAGALVAALLGVLITRGGTQALLALAGTASVPVGWRLVESDPVRRRLVTATGRLRSTG